MRNSQTKSVPIRWYLLMAWRDSRRNKARLLLFTSSIILGIAALTAISSFRNSLFLDIEKEAKTLLGADLSITSNQVLNDTARTFLENLGQTKASEVNFASMILFPKNQGTRLVQIRALEGNYPFYGQIETLPSQVSQNFQKSQAALVDKTVLLQFDAKIGDSILVGNLKFRIVGELLKVPGQNGIAASVAPVVYIPKKYVQETGLLQRGSRVSYVFYYLFENQEVIDKKVAEIEPKLKKWSLRSESVADRKKNVGRTFENLSLYLNLVGFVALLLGCVGVASAVQIYLKEKVASVAVLRCLGASNTDAFLIFLLQILGMGLTGSVIGTSLGMAFQFYLPKLLNEFLPLETSAYFSWQIIFSHILMGCLISVLFALSPLLSVRKISPLLTLRVDDNEAKRDWASYVVYGFILIFVWAFSYWQFGKLTDSLIFTTGILGAFGFLTLVANLVIWSVRKFFPVSWSYIWRQGLSNLYRPNNQTLTLMVTIGLGTALLTTLLLLQGFLIGEISMQNDGSQPNMMLFDIQSPQKQGVRNLLEKNKLPILEDVPVITMRLAGINGKNRDELKKDTTSQIPEWALDREYRMTYRDSLTEAEELVEGIVPKKVQNANDSIGISIEADYAARMNVKIGDRLDFDVQGVQMTTYIVGLRKVNWRRMQSNFLIVFPSGVLENAPQFHILLTQAANKSISAKIQKDLVNAFPNVSVIDLGLILKTLGEVLDKISFVIRFMAGFSVLTGFLVLLGSVFISKYQRIKESVLLRTLGASSRQILAITWVEYFTLGVLASLTGILLAIGSSWLLAFFVLKVRFIPDFGGIFVVFTLISSLTSLIGIYNINSILRKTPLEVLRNEL